MSSSRRSMLHQFRSTTATHIFGQPSQWYQVDFERKNIPEFEAMLKFKGDDQYSKYAPILFLNGERDMKNIFKSVPLTKVSFEVIVINTQPNK